MIERYPTAAAFRMAAGPFLEEREAEHNLLFGITSNLLLDEARGVEPARSPYLATVARDGRIVGAALMTPPWQVVVSCLGPADEGDPDPDLVRELAAEIADDLGRFRPVPPGVLAPVAIAREFAKAWCRPRGLVARRAIAERIYRLERVIAPTGVPGSDRIATMADQGLLLTWMQAFMVDAFGRTDDAQAQRVVERGLELGERTFHLWEVDGEPVSVAALGGPTPHGIRLGPVYTPDDRRGRGYGSAVTAAASQAGLDAGRRFVFLFTDLANPTSNHIYQAIGYEAVIDVDQVRFEG